MQSAELADEGPPEPRRWLREPRHPIQIDIDGVSCPDLQFRLSGCFPLKKPPVGNGQTHHRAHNCVHCYQGLMCQKGEHQEDADLLRHETIPGILEENPPDSQLETLGEEPLLLERRPESA